ncbi:MAG: viroplasmin family protein [Saprospiraceae bacterium]
MAKKYYVVWEGKKTGIFQTWDECKVAIKGYPNAKYKSFPNSLEAVEAFRGSANDHIGGNKKKPKSSNSATNDKILKNTISVDAACSGNPGLMEYRGVITDTKEQIFIQGPFKYGTNNVGEFLALVHGLALLDKRGDYTTPIYSDSKIAMGWVRKGKCNTKLQRINSNEILFELIERGEAWLKKNKIKNPILKWETKEWGEIPADFGRK